MDAEDARLPEYLKEITDTPGAVWDHYQKRWQDPRTGKLVDPPTVDELRGASTDDALSRLQQLVPELEHVLKAYKEQTITHFIGALLDRTAAVANVEIVSAARVLIAGVLQEKAQGAAKSSSWGYTIDSKVNEIVTKTLSTMIAAALEERLRQTPNLIKEAIDKALQADALHTEVQNLITPKLVAIIQELRLELTAGAGRR